MIDLQIQGVKELELALEGTSKKLPRELTIAVNSTARKVRTGMSKQIRGELVVKSADLNKILNLASKAKPTSIVAKVLLFGTKRLSLKAFKPRQTRKGVSYKVSKSKGRKVAPSAFMGPRPGAIAIRLRGHAYKRMGRARYPIARLHGPSPGGVYALQKMRPKTIVDGVSELNKQIERRIRFNLLKKQGLI